MISKELTMTVQKKSIGKLLPNLQQHYEKRARKRSEGPERGSACPYMHRLIDKTRSLRVDVGQRKLCCVVSIPLFQSCITKLPIFTPIAKVSCGNLFACGHPEHRFQQMNAGHSLIGHPNQSLRCETFEP